MRQVIEPQLQSTPLGRWIDRGHNHLMKYVSSSTGGIISNSEYEALGEKDQVQYIPVEIDMNNDKVLGRQYIDNRVEEPCAETIENVIDKSPQWMKNIWRGNHMSDDKLRKILDMLEKDDLCVAGDGSVRDQLGSYAWCVARKSMETPTFTFKGPVDGHRHHMRALRAESTHVLASIAMICRLEKFVQREKIKIPIYTDCKGLINRIMTSNINSPSMVMSDHIDLTYEIRSLIASSKFEFDFVHTQTIKNDDFDMGTFNEKLLQSMHEIAYGYFTQQDALTPRKYSDYLYGSQISIVANGKPIVSDIGMTLQMMERVAVRESYIQERFNLHENMISNIDQYTLGRVIMKNPSRHAMYTKIIHGELNTMVVNEKWSQSSDRCPVCLNAREDWLHPLMCQSVDMIRKRYELLIDFDERLRAFKTYPPLRSFIVNFFKNLYRCQKPEAPTILDPKYIVEFNAAYEKQEELGWNNFCRGIVSQNWRYLQHCNILERKMKDVHAVDKWTRMLIGSILEYNRLLWKERCDILHAENEFTYENRKREGIWKFCLHLRQKSELVTREDRHLLWKPQSFFFRKHIDNVLNWESRMRISMMVHDDNTPNDIRKYMTSEVRDVNTNTNKRRMMENDTAVRRPKRWKQCNLDTFLCLPTRNNDGNDVTPPPVQQKRKHPSENQRDLEYCRQQQRQRILRIEDYENDSIRKRKHSVINPYEVRISKKSNISVYSMNVESVRDIVTNDYFSVKDPAKAGSRVSYF